MLDVSFINVEVFVHFSHILSNHRFKTLQIGELVEYYDIEVFHHNKTPKGPAARAVTGIGGCEIIGDANAEALFQQYGPCCYSEFPENGYQYPIYFPQGYHP
jgi:cold shock CspA family protein